MHLENWQIVCGGLAAFVVGFSKTGLPGSGILMVPLMAAAFGGRLSVGATLPMLVFADCFAVAFYRQHAEWNRLKVLAPWVVVGLFIGTGFLKYLGDHHANNDLLNPIIGGIVLAMLVLHLLRGKLGDKLVPTSPIGTRFTGVVAGFTTLVSNAAGPLMSIYMTATGMAKDQLMGTTAWYFFIFNLSKVPLLLWLNADNQAAPIFTLDTLTFDLWAAPVILVGALVGRQTFRMIPQKAFVNSILILSAIAAVKIILTK